MSKTGHPQGTVSQQSPLNFLKDLEKGIFYIRQKTHFQAPFRTLKLLEASQETGLAHFLFSQSAGKSARLLGTFRHGLCGVDTETGMPPST